jgi:hypothetical protein
MPGLKNWRNEAIWPFPLESAHLGHIKRGMLIVAAATANSALIRLGQVPIGFWVRMAIIIGLIVGVVLLLRKLANMNKFVLSMVAGVFLTVMGFTWIYERNEPTWATPAVDFLADFLPTKGKLAQR